MEYRDFVIVTDVLCKTDIDKKYIVALLLYVEPNLCIITNMYMKHDDVCLQQRRSLQMSDLHHLFSVFY